MSKATLLVTGGAGFIGSHMVKMLAEQGYQLVIIDNLKQGHADAVLAGELIVTDLADTKTINKIFETYNFTTVLHFAALIAVGESIEKPERYFQNNTENTLNLLNIMCKHNVKQFIFSSTAAIYGNPQYCPIDTEHPKNPINPYGESKWRVEQALVDYEKQHGLRSISLRYFNAAGCDPDTQLGDRHMPQTHLIPLILLTALGKRDAITVYGNDYNTPDGTCLRDYIHVTDLCQAHLLAMQALDNGKPSTAYNLGTGQGYSINNVIDVANTITEKNINIIQGQRRAGDPAELIADASKAMQELGWQPQYSELTTIIKHAWAAFKKFY